MTELPENKAKNFGLGPRTFSKSTNPKTKQDKSWTQTPNDKASGEKEDTSNPEQDEEVSESTSLLQLSCLSLLLCRMPVCVYP